MQDIFRLLLCLCSVQLTTAVCSQYGCTPGNNYWQNFQVPTPRAISAGFFLYGPALIPQYRGHGCVANDETSYCPVHFYDNGNRSYIDLYVFGNKALASNLSDPAFPIILDNGDALGCDGQHLSLIHNDTTIAEDIPLPIKGKYYSLKMTSDGYVVAISQLGQILVYNTGRALLGSSKITGAQGTVKGVYAPISTPAVNGSRLFMITQFLPDNEEDYEQTETEFQVHAVDIDMTMTDGVKVAWNYSFAPLPAEVINKFKTDWINQTDIMYFRGKVFVNFIYPFVLEDYSDHVKYFAVYPIPVKHIVANGFWAGTASGDPKAAGPVNRTNAVIGVGADIDDSKIAPKPELYEGVIIAFDYQVNKGLGFIIYMSQLLGAKVNITSKVNLLSDVKTPTDSEDMVFGISVTNKTEKFFKVASRYQASPNGTNYVVAIRGHYKTYEGEVLWMVYAANDARTSGQIVGSNRGGQTYFMGYSETKEAIAVYYGITTLENKGDKYHKALRN